MSEFAKPLQLGAANTPVQLSTALTAAGYAGFMGLAELTITNDGSEAGNLTVSSDSAANGEEDGVPIDSLTMRSGGGISDTIDPTKLYLLSATANKKYFVQIRSKV